MDYSLPEGFNRLSTEDRIEWHAKRVAVEEPAYRYLEIIGLWNCKEPAEVQCQLADFREEKQEIEALLILYEDVEFQVLKTELDDVMSQGYQVMHQRSRILACQFRRMTFASQGTEKRRLNHLKQQTYEILVQAEEVEKRLTQVCRRHRVDSCCFVQSHILKQ
jgi:hypothetical protein